MERMKTNPKYKKAVIDGGKSDGVPDLEWRETETTTIAHYPNCCGNGVDSAWASRNEATLAPYGGKPGGGAGSGFVRQKKRQEKRRALRVRLNSYFQPVFSGARIRYKGGDILSPYLCP